MTPEGIVNNNKLRSASLKSLVGVNDNELLLIVTELPIPKFSTTVPAALAILNVILPLPALIF